MLSVLYISFQTVESKTWMKSSYAGSYILVPRFMAKKRTVQTKKKGWLETVQTNILALLTCSSETNPTIRGAESQTWALGQLKYFASPVLRTPKQTGKMPRFCPDFHGISKKKGLRSSTYWFLSVILMGPLLGPLKPTDPMMGLPKSMGPGVIVPPFPPLVGPANNHLN